MEADPADALGDDVGAALHDRGEIRQDDVAGAAGVAPLRQHVEIDAGDDRVAGLVAGRADVGDLGDDVDRRGVGAVLGVEQGDVAGRGGNGDGGTGGAVDDDAAAGELAFGAAAGDGEGNQ